MTTFFPSNKVLGTYLYDEEDTLTLQQLNPAKNLKRNRAYVDLVKLKELFEKGVTYKDMAKQLGIPFCRVESRIFKLGLKRERPCKKRVKNVKLMKSQSQFTS